MRSNHTLTVSVNDANNGGAAITDYQYSTDGGATWHSSGSASSPLTITTLSTNGTTQIANGTSYPVQVRAVNAAGVSVASTTTNVGPAAPPSAPIVSLAAGNGSANGHLLDPRQRRLADHGDRVRAQQQRQLDQRRHAVEPVHDQRPDQRHGLHGQRAGRQRDRQRHRVELGVGDAVHRSGRADHGRRDL